MKKIHREALKERNGHLKLYKERHHGIETICMIPIDYNQLNNGIMLYNENSPFSHKVSLAAEPHETLTLRFIIQNFRRSNSCYQCHDKKSYITFKINLNFHNNLHEISQDYVYVIKLEILKKDNQHMYYANVFTHEKKRSDNIMSVQNTSLLTLDDSSAILDHMLCSISRFHDAKVLVNESSFSNSIGEMLLSRGGNYSDVSLLVGDKIFAVHRLVLESKSDVFKAMFTSGMVEAKSGLVSIDDTNAEVIEEMLHYIYTGKTTKMSELSQELFQVANKYQIIDLRAKCEEYFIFNLTCENAVQILDLARVYELESLRKSVAAFVSKHEEDMVKEQSYQEFLCRDLTADRIVSILELCAKYNLEDVKLKAFKVVHENKEIFAVNQAFLDLLVSHPNLSKSFFAMLLLSIK